MYIDTYSSFSLISTVWWFVGNPEYLSQLPTGMEKRFGPGHKADEMKALKLNKRTVDTLRCCTRNPREKPKVSWCFQKHMQVFGWEAWFIKIWSLWNMKYTQVRQQHRPVYQWLSCRFLAIDRDEEIQYHQSTSQEKGFHILGFVKTLTFLYFWVSEERAFGGSFFAPFPWWFLMFLDVFGTSPLFSSMLEHTSAHRLVCSPEASTWTGAGTLSGFAKHHGADVDVTDLFIWIANLTAPNTARPIQSRRIMAAVFAECFGCWIIDVLFTKHGVLASCQVAPYWMGFIEIKAELNLPKLYTFCEGTLCYWGHWPNSQQPLLHVTATSTVDARFLMPSCLGSLCLYLRAI